MNFQEHLKPRVVLLLSMIAVGALGLTMTSLTHIDRKGEAEASALSLELTSLVTSQYECAKSIAARKELFLWSVSSRVDTVALAFEALQGAVCDQRASVELLDARGDVLAWSGRSWRTYEADVPVLEQDPVVRIVRSGAFVVLETIVNAMDGQAFVRMTHPISSDNQITAEIVPSVWLRSDVSRSFSRIFVVPLGETAPPGYDTTAIYGDSGSTIGFIATMHGVLSEGDMQPGLSVWLLLIAAGILLLISDANRPSFLRLVVSLSALWFFRYILLWFGVNRDPLLGPLGDPSVYASSFGAGLVGSPIDLFLSTGTLLLSIVWIYRRSGLRDGRPTVWKSPLFAGLFLPLGSGVLLLLTRGYAASIRSMVVDATVHMYDRSSLLPSSEIVPLLISSLMLTISVVVVWKVLIHELARAADTLGFESWLYKWGLVSLSVLIATGTYTTLDATDVMPPWIPFIGLFVMIPLVVAGQRYSQADARNRILWGLAITLFAVPTIDWHVHLGQREEIRRSVEERMSPGDAWLTFLMQSDLESIAIDNETIRLLSGAADGDGQGTAFSLWSASVMSKQSANSGLVIFDEDGKEVDRFVIGFSTFEQDAILRTVFEGAEERIYVVEGGDLGRRMSIYGAWSTVRDDDNRVYGTIATILSPSDEQPLYWAVGKPSTGRRPQYAQAQILDSVIVMSEIPALRTGDRLDERIARSLERPDWPWIWIRDRDAEGDLLFVADAGMLHRVTAVFVPDMDIRWHMFHIAKILLVYALVLLIASFFRYLRDRRKGERSVLSFRSKMFAVFTVVSTAPLMLLAIYNDQISEERTEQEVSRSLEQTGETVVARMQELFQSEGDIQQGISNDFCAALAADLGVEFSLYRTIQLVASSRPEVFESGILGRRLDADVFTRLMLRGQDAVIQRQSIGPVSYAVGYFIWRLDGKRAGIVSVPTLFRQGEIEADLAERNAYVLVAYGFALLLVLLLGWFFSDRVTRPIRQLTTAAGALGRGEHVPALRSTRSDEIGTLVRTFNEMVRELEENRTLLAKAEREQAWREMAKQVAHEIKNPLTPMKLSVQQLLQSFKDKARNREETLWDVSTTLLEQIDALSRIASEFSHFARLPQGKFEKVDVLRTIREASGLFSSVPGIMFSIDVPSGHAHVIADADELRRVFVNLIRNSIQAMEGEGTVSIRASKAAGRLDVWVEDTGPGVPEELTEKVFEPNFSTKTEGMGLGLAISRKILEDLGGSIRVTRRKTGACFTLVFPLQ